MLSNMSSCCLPLFPLTNAMGYANVTRGWCSQSFVPYLLYAAYAHTTGSLFSLEKLLLWAVWKEGLCLCDPIPHYNIVWRRIMLGDSTA
ncbi:hypothetical protein BDQ17DRAFT_1361144, partial [Cyathus striatus]